MALVGMIAIGCNGPRDGETAVRRPSVSGARIIERSGVGGAERVSILNETMAGTALPATVVVRLKPGERPQSDGTAVGSDTVSFQARLEPDGAWSTLPLRSEDRKRGNATYEIPCEYPAGAKIRVRVRSKLGDDEAVLDSLPKSVPAFDLDEPPTTRATPGQGVAIDAVAYRPKPRKPGDNPVVGVLLRVKAPTAEHQRWQLANIAIHGAYAPPEGLRNSSSVTPIVFERGDIDYAEEKSRPFVDGSPRVEVTADLGRFDEATETVDYGTVRIVRKGRSAYVNPITAIERKLKDGTTVKLMPLDPKMMGSDDRPETMLCVSADNGPDVSQGDLYVSPASAPDAIARAGGFPTTHWGSSPTNPLRLRFMRVRRVESYSVRLTPEVRNVPFHAQSGPRNGYSSATIAMDPARSALFPKN